MKIKIRVKKSMNKTKRQKNEYNNLHLKLNYITSWLNKNTSPLKLANKMYYLGDITHEQSQLLSMKRHLLEKEKRIKKLLWN